MMIGAVDKHHVGIVYRLRRRQASEPAPDDDNLFMRHESEPWPAFFTKTSTATANTPRAAKRGAAVILSLTRKPGLTLAEPHEIRPKNLSPYSTSLAPETPK
jgi:hypothetical protein